MCSSTLSLTSALDGVGGQRHAPAALPLGMTRYPLSRRLGGPQNRSGQVWKISPPPVLISTPGVIKWIGFTFRPFLIMGNSFYNHWVGEYGDIEPVSRFGEKKHLLLWPRIGS
jgi:hypothetical protein